ncbi:ATP-binding protein [Alteromonas sp. ASW11-130]|uniref:ATP-binding protein n=1 Tax=Alteromonas sp. ASW11-130 TaxID=3015775 RepID=UPI0022425A6D|nr:ATP-binding protein [Alteromonas sp. ASW11-130]MCW8091563.1 ATP-binding protein [Alteromonas sp. ASW11-130]
MSIAIGEVIAVKGVNILVELYEESNKETLFYQGEKFKGVSIQEHILIKRGFKDIVALVQGEYLDERFEQEDGKSYVRKVELKPIGYYDQSEFYEGIKHLPMIRDVAYLMNEQQVRQIYGEADDSFVIGEILKEELPVSLPWASLFNTHIGVFGNTGSGKSNTLTNLYTTLFTNKLQSLNGKSHFVVVDFNGEYTGKQLINDRDFKQVYDLDTRGGGDSKFPLSESVFWDEEVFGILFKATENTQKPFLKRVVSGRERFRDTPDSLDNYAKKTIARALKSTSPKKEFAELVREIADIVGADGLRDLVLQLSWHSKNSNFYYLTSQNTLNGGDDDGTYLQFFDAEVEAITIGHISQFEELRLRVNIQLLSDLVSGYVQFDHIQPLLKRVEASLKSLERVFQIGENPVNKLLTVVSLRKSNQEIKKVIPLLLAKYYYGSHKDEVINDSPPSHTFHMIIDEAHNILSMQSNRESESWKDYRLELFEEIIKEGRKFGFYLTLSSQRPADISPTIMSQIHNFFIHRLVNDRDLMLLDNTISTLDSLSRSMIPNLSKGCAVITGTSFDIPMVVQFKPLEKESQPDSGDVDLHSLWSD